VTLSACRAVVDTKVEKDGSGELRTSIVFSAEEKRNFDSAPDNAGKSICDNLKSDASPQADLIEQAQGNETYCTTVHSFNSLKQLRDYYEAMVNVTVLELGMGLGNFVFQVQVDLTPRNGNEAAPNEWRLTVPGNVGENNADLIEGNTLVWNIEPGEVRTLQAKSDVGPAFLIQLLLGGLIVLAGIAVAVRLARNVARRNEEKFVSIQIITHRPSS
jgi:hypothetical protein